MRKPHKPDVRIDELVKRISADFAKANRKRDFDSEKLIRFAVERAVGNNAYAHPTSEIPPGPRKGKRAA